MCGRYATGTLSWEQILDMTRFFVDVPGIVFGLPAEYNIAPNDLGVPIIVSDRKYHCAAMARFGLTRDCFEGRPEDPKHLTFNVSSEDVTEMTSLRSLLEIQRSLIPAQHFYEWMEPGKPYLIGNKDGSPMFFAGLLAHNSSGGQHFAIMTTAANDFMRQIHNRMPVILKEEDYKTWLTADLDEALAVAGQYPSELMQAYPVGAAVGNVRNQGPELAAPVGEAI